MNSLQRTVSLPLKPTIVSTAANNDGSNNGCIILIVGPMNAGKSTELCRFMERHQFAGRRCCLIKYRKDRRFTTNMNELATRNGLKLPATEAETLAEVELEADTQVIGIDEIQFFTDALHYCEQWANEGKTVIASGLNGTYKRETFPVMKELFAVAEQVYTITAVCRRCGRDASFTKRLSDETDLEAIDAHYMATCRRCHNEEFHETA